MGELSMAPYAEHFAFVYIVDFVGIKIHPPSSLTPVVYMCKEHLDMVGDTTPNSLYHCGFRVIFKMNAVFYGKCLKTSNSC